MTPGLRLTGPRAVAAVGLSQRRFVDRRVRDYARLSIARKLLFFPALTAVALGLVLLVTVGLGLTAERRLARLGDTYYPRVERTWRLDQTLEAINRSLQDAASTDDAEFLERADSLADAFDALLGSRGGRGAPGATAESDRLRRLFADYYRAGRAIPARVRAREVGDSIAAALGEFHVRQLALRAALDASARDDRAALVAAIAAERTRQRLGWIASVVITLVFVLAVVALARLATRLVTVPLRQIVSVADRVAEGDLTVRLPAPGDDEVGHLVRVMGRMVDNLRHGEQQLTHLAYHDALTGLANRARFRQRLARAAADPAGRATLAVVYIDLDDFKTVNDSLGHAAGDALLLEVAERLRRATRGCDTVARLGGDEFAVLLRGVQTAGDAAIVAERIARSLDTPARVHGTDLRVRASVGIALGAEALGSDVLSADGDAEQAAEDLLRFADVAMYAAKHGGKGHHVLFEPDMHRRAQERRTLEHDLREAVDGGQLRVHYQPIVRLDTGETVAAEALVRWQHPTRGMVSPSDFIPLAEHTGLVASIGKWVLEAACRDAASWRADAAGRGAPRVTVNVSAAQLQRSDLVADVSAALTGAGLEPGTLTLEITETAMLADNDGAVVARLAELQALGVSIALDDFGTGYSSLSYLQRLPLDVIKIDKTFVKGIGVSGHDPVLTRAIIALGGALGVRVVAEGIERPWQASALRALGCTLGQGHHFAHPLPADAFRRWLATSAVIPSGARNPHAASV